MKDIQNQKDTRNIFINKVGVKDLKYPVVLEDRENGKQHTVANVSMFVELPRHYRGTHMSRFVEILNNYHRETIIDNLENLLLEMKRKLDAKVAYIEFEFPYFIKKKAPVSEKVSQMSYQCKFDGSYGDDFIMEMVVKVPVQTLCPCSKEISDFGAHNQRSYVTISAVYSEFIWLEELIEVAERAGSTELYSLLKREDEKYVTEKAYQNPQFVEDVVRNISNELKGNPRIISYKVEADSMESIHNHNAYAMVKSD